MRAGLPLLFPTPYRNFVIKEEALAAAIHIRDDGAVLMRLYPQTDLLVEVARPTALHLYSLVQRYNATLGKPGWKSFWPRITQIERSMVVLVVEANGVRDRGLSMWALIDEGVWCSGAADDFRKIAASARRKSLTEDVEKALVELYRVHLRATVPVEKARAAWEVEYPKIVALLRQQGVYEPLFEDGRCYDDEHVFSVVHDVLLKHGHDAVQGGGGDDALGHEFWCCNAADLFAGHLTLIEHYARARHARTGSG